MDSTWACNDQLSNHKGSFRNRENRTLTHNTNSRSCSRHFCAPPRHHKIALAMSEKFGNATIVSVFTVAVLHSTSWAWGCRLRRKLPTMTLVAACFHPQNQVGLQGQGHQLGLRNLWRHIWSPWCHESALFARAAYKWSGDGKWERVSQKLSERAEGACSGAESYRSELSTSESIQSSVEEPPEARKTSEILHKREERME